MKFTTNNPATEQVIKEWQTMPKKEVFDILDSTHKAYSSWKKLSINDRCDYLRKLARVLRDHKSEYANMMAIEMGKPIRDGVAEVEKCAWSAEIYAENALEWTKDDIREADGKEHRIVLQPLGVIFAIMPWNYPFWQVFRFAIPTLLGGNTAILKHASNVSECALMIEKAFKQANFPKNVFRTVIADHETVGELIASPLVRGVSLTGSTQAGKRVAELAGKHLKPVVLELGGSDPFIVLEDADLDVAAKNAMVGRFINNGQSCISSKRFIVHHSIAKKFESKFVQYAEKMVVGNPLDEKTNLGPLVNRQAVEQIELQVSDALKKGGKVLLGGKRVEGKGFFYSPTIITNTTPDMDIVKEEVFGPVAAIIPFKTEKEALQIANSVPYGLGGSVWTKDLERGKKIAEQIDSGAVFVNSITKSDPRMPFGGTKESGIGRELSDYALREFCNIKAINVYEHK